MNTNIISIIKNGGVGVLPTDTIYGLVCSPFHPEAVERIYNLKKRNPKKPLVMVIGDISDLKQFDIGLSSELIEQLNQFWPGPVSIILPCPDEKWAYLHRGEKSLAFRLPNNAEFLELLAQTGPLYTSSVNYEGEPPATTIEEAKHYFGDSVDFYIDHGQLSSKPSQLIRLDGDNVTVIRPYPN